MVDKTNDPVNSLLPKRLRNRYFAMRHGRSEANAAGIVVSDPERGIAEYGLSNHGRKQVLDAIQRQGQSLRRCRIVSSDFLRARQTAELAHHYLGLKEPVRYDARLRERFFGVHEGGDDKAYPVVWALDMEDPRHEEGQVESAVAVQRRVADVINALEHDWQGEVLLIVAHGDPLQILQTAFAGISAAHHRDLPHLETAAIRELIRQ